MAAVYYVGQIIDYNLMSMRDVYWKNLALTDTSLRNVKTELN
jgi:hypothetical protein